MTIIEHHFLTIQHTGYTRTSKTVKHKFLNLMVSIVNGEYLISKIFLFFISEFIFLPEKYQLNSVGIFFSLNNQLFT